MTRLLPDHGFRGEGVEPLVSVSITTFGHERFIRQAVESVLMQETDFPFEVIVGDDCSADRTRTVLRELQREHPERIRLVFPERNLDGRGLRLFARTLEAARGRYIAAMDGDDYWLAPHKLRTQVDFLEAHPQCSMCFHDVEVRVEEQPGRAWRLNDPAPPTFSGMRDILRRNYIGACSPMFRRAVLCPLPEWYFGMVFGDWPLYVLAAEQGLLGYIDEVMGVYRVHTAGMWSSSGEMRQWETVLEFCRQLDTATSFRYSELLRSTAGECWYLLALEHSRRGALRQARSAAWQALRAHPAGKGMSREKLLVRLLRSHVGQLLGRPAPRAEEA